MLLNYTYVYQIGNTSPYRGGRGGGDGAGRTGDKTGDGYGDSSYGFEGDNAVKLADRGGFAPWHEPGALAAPGVKVSTCEDFEGAVLLLRMWPLEELGC